jgi:Fe-S-cluster containining protein
MEVDCEGCAGCCLDWRPLAPDDLETDHERRGPYRPLDDTYNLASLSSDEVRAFLDRGYAAALTPRLFATDDGPHVTVDGVELAAVAGRPAFLVGLRKVPKPVAPFDADPAWLDTCAFLDPVTLQCRIHDTDEYPETCRTYPGANLALGVDTECERVERAGGGQRLLDDEAPEDAAPAFGPGAVGARVFGHPDPDRIAGAVERLLAGEATAADRAEFVAVAAAASPGTIAVDDDRYERARARALESTSWVDDALAEWTTRAAERASAAGTDTGSAPGRDAGAGADPDTAPDADPTLARDVEDARGAPGTPGWD